MLIELELFAKLLRSANSNYVSVPGISHGGHDHGAPSTTCLSKVA